MIQIIGGFLWDSQNLQMEQDLWQERTNNSSHLRKYSQTTLLINKITWLINNKTQPILGQDFPEIKDKVHLILSVEV